VVVGPVVVVGLAVSCSVVGAVVGGSAVIGPSSEVGVVVAVAIDVGVDVTVGESVGVGSSDPPPRSTETPSPLVSILQPASPVIAAEAPIESRNRRLVDDGAVSRIVRAPRDRSPPPCRRFRVHTTDGEPQPMSRRAGHRPCHRPTPDVVTIQ
jgi:hypothetical protein